MAKLLGIHRIRMRINVNKVRTGARLRDCLCGSDERVRHRQNHVARPDPCRTQCKAQRVRSAVYPDTKLGIAVFCEVAFKSFDHRPADKAGRCERRLEHANQFLLQLAMRSDEINKRNLCILTHEFTFWLEVIERNTFAGFPTTIVFGGTSRVTTLPAPTIAFSPMVTLERIVAPDPIEAPFFTKVSSTFQSDSVCRFPSAAVARGNVSLTKVTPCPTKTSSSIVTPSQTNVWLEILQFFPTVAFFCISTNAPIFVLSPISHPYRLMNLESFTPLPNFTLGAIAQYSLTVAPTVSFPSESSARPGGCLQEQTRANLVSADRLPPLIYENTKDSSHTQM